MAPVIALIHCHLANSYRRILLLPALIPDSSTVTTGEAWLNADPILETDGARSRGGGGNGRGDSVGTHSRIPMSYDKNSITPLFVVDILLQDVYRKAMFLGNVHLQFRTDPA